jgi:hypothetical protein
MWLRKTAWRRLLDKMGKTRTRAPRLKMMAAVLPIYELETLVYSSKLADAKMGNDFLPKASAFFVASQRDRKNLT